MKPLPRLTRVAAGSAPWVVGAALGLALALTFLGSSPGTALDSDAAAYEVALDGEITQEDIDALLDFVEANPGRDLVLEPAYPLDVAPGQVRRFADEERAAVELAELEASINERLASGEYSMKPVAPQCEGLSKSGNSQPAVYRLCGNALRPVEGASGFLRAKSRAEAEALLAAYVEAVLSGVAADEKSLGLRSSFSDAGALEQLSLSHDGGVAIDFNHRIVPQIEGLHPGSSTHYMLEQLFRTLFQFRDIRSVTLMLGGSCEAFGEIIEGPCQDLDRELWEQMTALNGERVAYFTLRGVE